MAIRVRSYQPGDLPLVVDLFRRGMERGRRAWDLPPLPPEKSRREALSYMRKKLRKARGRGGFALVADLDGARVGFVSVEIHRYRGERGKRISSAEIQELHVRPGYRRRGVGSALMADAERELRHRGCLSAFLFTPSNFTLAHAFYRQRRYKLRAFQFGKNLR